MDNGLGRRSERDGWRKGLFLVFRSLLIGADQSWVGNPGSSWQSHHFSLFFVGGFFPFLEARWASKRDGKIFPARDKGGDAKSGWVSERVSPTYTDLISFLRVCNLENDDPSFFLSFFARDWDDAHWKNEPKASKKVFFSSGWREKLLTHIIPRNTGGSSYNLLHLAWF